MTAGVAHIMNRLSQIESAIFLFSFFVLLASKRSNFSELIHKISSTLLVRYI